MVLCLGAKGKLDSSIERELNIGQSELRDDGLDINFKGTPPRMLSGQN